MDIKQYLKEGTNLGDKVEEFDLVLLNVLEKGMKQIYINHARKSGATEEWINSIETLGSMTVAHIVSIIYGEPTK